MQGSEAGEDRLTGTTARVELTDTPDSVTIDISGDWRLALSLPSASEVEGLLAQRPDISVVSFSADRLGSWDTGLLAFVSDIAGVARKKEIRLSTEGLPPGVQRLMALASAGVEERADLGGIPMPSFLARLGDSLLRIWGSSLDVLSFLGEVTSAFLKMCGGRTRFRLSELLRIVQDCGFDALPIVSLICVLVGLILAFVGSIQLRIFGAQLYIADLVGISMTRAMGAIMAGIIMAGRTGASFAARIGTMQVNEEIDALRTTGIPPVEFLVLPRVLGLAIMMPLLTLYADLMGILGGLVVSVFGFDMTVAEYIRETRKAVNLVHIGIGCFSGLTFGILIALAGCLRGMQCGRSASAVGEATTSAVVTGIVSIIVATAIITVACNVLGI